MRTSFRPVLCLFSLCMLPQLSSAQLLGPFTVRVGAGVEHDSNVLRTRDNEQSDVVGTVTLGVKGDKQYGLQRFRLDAEATRYNYRDFSEASYSTVNYLAAWDFQVTPKLQGIVSAERRQYRDLSGIGAVDLTGGQRPIGAGGRTDRLELIEARYLIDGPWRVLGGASQSSSRSLEARRDFDRAWDASPEVRSVRIGAAYEFASGTEFAARLKRGDGEYRDFPAALGSPDFRENEAEVTLRWQVTAKTGIDGRLAYVERNHSGAPGLNFDGPVGHGTISFEATPKSRIAVGVATELYSYQLDGTGHVRNYRFFARPVYKPTVQTEVSVTYTRERRNWRGTSLGSVDNGRRDTGDSLVAAFGWEPRRNIMVTSTLRYERRNSNVPLNQYRLVTAGVGATYSF